MLFPPCGIERLPRFIDRCNGWLEQFTHEREEERLEHRVPFAECVPRRHELELRESEGNLAPALLCSRQSSDRGVLLAIDGRQLVVGLDLLGPKRSDPRAI